MFRAQQSLQIQTERPQRSDLQHSTTRNTITKVILLCELADDIEHGSFLAGESNVGRPENWPADFESSALYPIYRQTQILIL